MNDFNKKIQAQFDKMCATGKLFRIKDTVDLWQWYLSSFKDSPKFRDPNSSIHNCNTCHNFIRRYGNIVAINENNEIITVFDISLDKDDEMYPVALALSTATWQQGSGVQILLSNPKLNLKYHDRITTKTISFTGRNSEIL